MYRIVFFLLITAQLYKSQNKRFVYEYSFAEDSTQLDIKKREFLNLDIHKNSSRFYSYDIPEQDSLVRIKEKPKHKFPYQGIQYLDVIVKNYPDFNMTLYTSCQNYYQVNMQKKPKWKIFPEKEKILNFLAQKATTKLYNRKWTVWFTTDIPIQDGPYLLHGLPGLIVKAEDEKKGISFQLVEIKSLRNSNPEELPYYFRHKLISVTENSFKTILKNYFDKPSPQRNNDNNDLKQIFFDGNGKEISDSEFYRMVERNNKKALEKRNNLLRWDIIKK
ncbi:GLPGLI family protein [Chryseobacterium sp. APV1]|uniref:GLPGLI family protein n=1 Tax=Chryseobacterium urinae TaxID=3058400 RepID=A0ABT8U310_9FLAO|nr:GLPGLI family protein [Chryseobacterium sp. APV1]MDO3424836.1 GLPGLI family protein [Chryseobacterium sp. APV1]